MPQNLETTRPILKGIEKLAIEHLAGYGSVKAAKLASEVPLDTILKDPAVAEILKKQKVKDKETALLFLCLYGVGVPEKAIRRLLYFDKETLYKDIVENPYILTRYHGIGFKIADKLAKQLDIGLETRFVGCVMQTLKDKSVEGHTFEYKELLLTEVPLQMGEEIDKETLEQYLQTAVNGKFVRVFTNISSQCVCLEDIYQQELCIAQKINEMLVIPPNTIRYKKSALNGLAREQITAFKRSLANRISCITGFPGTGKTFLIKAIVDALVYNNKSVLVCAPTGRARKRLEDVLQRKCFTIHKALYDLHAVHNEDFLPEDYIIVDESSMLDSEIGASLFKSLGPNASIILVGDFYQLPPVGYGYSFRDVIISKKVPTTVLTEIFRQQEGSTIFYNAIKVKQGEMPDYKGSEKGVGYQYIREDNRDNYGSRVVSLIKEEMKHRNMDQIQVLAPMYRGSGGIITLNKALQNLFNPTGKPLIAREEYIIKAGDKILVNENLNDLDVCNGDTGFILDKTPDSYVLSINGRTIHLPFKHVRKIGLGYVCSYHKAQGNEYDCVICVLDKSHYILLDRNLLYTAITRAKKVMYLVSNWAAIAMTVAEKKAIDRKTMLEKMLRGEING